MSDEVERLKTLFESATELQASLDTEEVLNRSMQSVERATGADRSTLWKFDENERKLIPMISHGAQSEELPELNPGEGLCGVCFQERRTVRRSNVTNDDNWAGDPDEYTVNNTLCTPLRSSDGVIGVLQLLNKEDHAFTERDQEDIEKLARPIGMALHNALLFEQRQQILMEAITALADAIEIRDDYTGGHARRVADYTEAMADQLRLPEEQIHRARLAGIVHDLGKIGVEDSVLRKPGDLTDEEYRQIQKHSQFGYRILQDVSLPDGVQEGVLHHHESWNGQGYPDGIAGADIPLTARMIAVADAFDAMTTTRPYRESLPPDKALKELANQAGVQFDPRCVKAFLEVSVEQDMEYAPDVDPTVVRETADQLLQDGL